MTFEQRIIATAVLGAVAAAMIFARRWKNTDTDAGVGIAGWTIVILLFGIWSN